MNVDTSEFAAIRDDYRAAVDSVRDLARIIVAGGGELPPPRLTVVEGGGQSGGRHRRPRLSVVGRVTR